MKFCVVVASGKLGKYIVQYALNRDYEVIGVCREQSVDKLAEFGDRITVVSHQRRVDPGSPAILGSQTPSAIAHGRCVEQVG